jgi:NitT/TauT family transport system substrate-binding protein
MISNGPYLIKQQANMDVRSFLLNDIGYDPYGGILTVSQRLIDTKPDTVRCLVQGSKRGWEDFMRDPTAGFTGIRRMSPEVSQGLLDYAFKVIKDHHFVETEDTARLGLGAMTDARWKQHFDTLVATKLLPANFDYRSAYTTRFLDQPANGAAHP